MILTVFKDYVHIRVESLVFNFFTHDFKKLVESDRPLSYAFTLHHGLFWVIASAHD